MRLKQQRPIMLKQLTPCLPAAADSQDCEQKEMKLAQAAFAGTKRLQVRGPAARQLTGFN